MELCGTHTITVSRFGYSFTRLGYCGKLMVGIEASFAVTETLHHHFNECSKSTLVSFLVNNVESKAWVFSLIIALHGDVEIVSDQSVQSRSEFWPLQQSETACQRLELLSYRSITTSIDCKVSIWA